MPRIRYERKRTLAGWLFVAPWIIGALMFFIQPLVQSVIFSFCERDPSSDGGLNMVPLAGNAFQNYLDAFLKDPDFLWYFKDALTNMLYSVPAIIVFSLFIAILLSRPFKGRTFMRAIFFLPVIITSGIVIDIMQGSMANLSNNSGMETSNIFDNAMLIDLLLNSGLPRTLVDYLSNIVNGIIDLVWKSGVQILIFMSGILSIPRSYYEVGTVEGATGWEAFWKITFPMIIPHMMINLIYTSVDLLASYDNKVMRYIVDTIYTKVLFGYGSALSWLYFLSVFLFVGLLFLIISRFSHSDAK